MKKKPQPKRPARERERAVPAATKPRLSVPRARTGKVARLPIDLRENINYQLRDNVPGPQICDLVNSSRKLSGAAAITPQNLSEWRTGGYQEWLEDQKEAERLKRLSEYAYRLAEAAGGDMAAGSAAIAGGKILELLERSSDEDLEGLINSLSSLRYAELATHRLDLDRKKLDTKNRELSLAENRFQLLTAEQFVKWARSKEAQQILDSGKPRSVQVSKLRELMFGAPPDGDPAQKD
jgi:hypothetical protein